MADGDDPFASLIDDCLKSSSQEELLRFTKFAREDEIFDGDDGKPSALVDSGRHWTEFDGEDVVGGGNQVEFTGGRADCDEKEVLGFAVERKKPTIEVVLNEEVRLSEVQEAGENGQEGSSTEQPSPLKKFRVSGSKLKGENLIPLVQCSEKMGIDSEEDKGKQIVVSEGGFMFEFVRPLQCVAPSGVELCSEELVILQDEEMRGQKLQLEYNTDAMELEDDETIERKNNKEMGSDVDRGDGNGKGDENQKHGLSEGIRIPRKRGLPHSLVGQIGDVSADGIDGIGNGGVGAQNKEQCEKSAEEKNGQKSESDGKWRQILDVLKMIATQKPSDAADHEIDIFEAAKRRGMTFPCNRFLADVEKDEWFET